MRPAAAARPHHGRALRRWHPGPPRNALLKEATLIFSRRQALRQSEEEKERLLKRVEELKDDIDQYQADALAALKAKAVPNKRGG